MAAPKLADTAFQTKPDETLLVKDVYDVTTSAEVVNSYQDRADEGSFASDLANQIKNPLSIAGEYIKSGLPTTVDLKSLVGTAKGLLNTAKQGMAMAAKAAAAVNAIKNGNYAAALSQVSGLAKGAGLDAILPALRSAQRTVGAATAFAKNPTLSGAMRLGGSALGPEGAALTRLSSSIAASVNQAAQLSRAVDSGNLATVFSAASRMAGGANVLLGDMDRASQTNFGYAASKALGMNTAFSTQKATLDSLLGLSNGLSGKERTDQYGDNIVKASLLTGASYTAYQNGEFNVFSKTASFDSPDSLIVAKSAGIPLAAEAIQNGSYSLLNDIVSTPIASDVARALPNAGQSLIRTLTPEKKTPESQYSLTYDSLSSTLTKLDSNWKTNKVGDMTTLRSDSFASNAYAETLLESKVCSQSHNFNDATVSDEAFLLLGSRFKGESVQGSVKEDFPEYQDDSWMADVRIW